jgi:hypothetical protein
MRQIPPAGIIEAALGRLGSIEAPELNSEVKELRELGTRTRLDSISDNTFSPFERGYLLGLETARMLLLMLPAAQINNIEI